MVKRQATVLLIAGCTGVIANLFAAGVGYVDEFVAPLGIKAPPQSAQAASWQNVGYAPEYRAPDPRSERDSAVLGIITLFRFTIPSVLSIWSACGMLRLRNYWLAMAGSVAVIPGACLCFPLGMTAAIWSIVVLLRPEVSSVFR